MTSMSHVKCGLPVDMDLEMSSGQFVAQGH